MPDRAPTNAERERAARAVSDYCMLRDPRSDGVGTRIWNSISGFFVGNSVNDYSEPACIRRQIRGKASGDHYRAPAENSQEYNLIVARARALAAAGNARCLVREFNDWGDEPRPYYGYRGADRQCHVTFNENEALNARRRYPQTR